MFLSGLRLVEVVLGISYCSETVAHWDETSGLLAWDTITLDATRRLAENDPVVLAGRFVIELHLRLSFAGINSNGPAK